jgi:hypothetical protein
LIQNNEIDNKLDSSFCSVAGGVAVYIENAILFSSSNPGAVPLIIGNLIQDNTQAGHEDAGGIGGAGIAVFGETAVIEENVIRNNSTDAIGAAIHLETGSSSLIVGNVVYNNKSGGGGGALDYDSAYVDSGVYPTFNVFVANNTFVNNTYSGVLPNGFLNDNDVDQIYLGVWPGCSDCSFRQQYRRRGLSVASSAMWPSAAERACRRHTRRGLRHRNPHPRLA